MVSGPVHRNFGGNGPSSQNKKGGAARAFFAALFSLVVVLSSLAIYLSRKVMNQPHQPSSHRSGMGDAPMELHKKEAARRNPKPANNVATEKGVAPLPPKNRAPYPDNDGRDRVYCMVPFIWNEEIYKVIMETWGKRCDVINFLTDNLVGGKLKGDKIFDDPNFRYRDYTEFPPGTFPDNVIFINMTRTWNDCPAQKGEKKVCRHIWEKMWRSWVFVEENHLDQAEWFCKVDYDTFFFPENVKYFVRHKKWDPNTEYHYFGHRINHRVKGRAPMIAGATACWSRKTLDDIADVYRTMPRDGAKGERGKCEDRGQATEEASTSLCLKQHLNVSAYPARDDELREYITIAKYKDQLKWNRTEQGEWWYWKGKPKGAGEMENSIAFRPIGLHKYKSVPEIQELEQHFFGDPGNKFIKRLDERTKTYVKKVRKAMGTDP